MYIQHAANSGKRKRTESGRAESDQMLSCLDWQNQQSAISNQYPESSKKAVISFLCFSILLVMRTALMLLLVQKQLANS